IELAYWTSGLGEEYIRKTIENFEKKYPQYKVAYEPSPNGGAITNTFGYGANYDTVDLYMYAINAIEPEDLIKNAEPLDDLVNGKYENESITLGEKILPEFRSALMSDDGHYHSLTYGGGWTGIAYNRKIIDGVKYKIPNTTDELARLALDISDDFGSKGITPFIHYQNGGYWMTIASSWQIQYDGPDYYFNNFLPLKDSSGISPSKSVLIAEDGRKAAMDALEKLVTPGYVYNGSNALIFTDAQTLFLNDKAAMMVNGSWLINEMKQHVNENYDFSMMPTPVISSIKNKCTTIEHDAELSALITAVDAAYSPEEVPLTGAGYSVNEADRARIFEARYIMHSNFDQHGMVIPKYASAKEAAKLFVQYFYSDENLKMYHDVTHMTLPIRYSDGSSIDMNGWLAWEKQQQYFTEKCKTFFDSSSQTSKIFTAGGCSFYAGIDFISSFCNQNKNARQSSDQAWAQMVSIFNGNWDLYLNNAQLK
ncbi:MAG: extracellular solute-binding protein, partial [Clostridia bacterium]|nr:extracellular solute-binding protein [Clostridia bacterium]